MLRPPLWSTLLPSKGESGLAKILAKTLAKILPRSEKAETVSSRNCVEGRLRTYVRTCVYDYMKNTLLAVEEMFLQNAEERYSQAAVALKHCLSEGEYEYEYEYDQVHNFERPFTI